jgi:cell division protein FtsB
MNKILKFRLSKSLVNIIYRKRLHTEILDKLKSQKIGNELGVNFEDNIQKLLHTCEYKNAFLNPKGVIDNLFMNNQGGKFSSEFDAIVDGKKHSFDKFSDSFESRFIISPPNTEKHTAIVEVKLNYKLLKNWVDNKDSGSSYLFFNEGANQIYTKILVINGGHESKDFVNNLSSTEEINKYSELKKIIIENKINVFYKIWASSESFSDLISNYDILKEENKVLREENKVLREEIKVLREENKVLREDIKEVNRKFDYLVSKIDK